MAEETMDELARQLEPIRSLHPALKDTILRSFEGRSADDCRSYMAERLSLVRESVERVAHAEFATTCLELPRRLAEGDPFAEALLSGGKQVSTFLIHNRDSLSHSEVLLLVAHYWARTMPNGAPEAEVYFRLYAADALVGLDESSLAVGLLEAFVGLEPRRYRPPAELATRLQGSVLPKLPAGTAAKLVHTLGYQLLHANRPTDGVRLLEAYVWGGPGEYHSTDALAVRLADRLRPHLENNEWDTAAILVRVLADALLFVERDRDGLTTLEAILGLRVERDRDGLTTLKAILGLRMGYGDPSSLALRLRASLLSIVAENTAAALVITLAVALSAARDRPTDGVCLLEAYVWGGPGEYHSTDALAVRLADRLRPLAPDNGALIARSLGVGLRAAHRPVQGVGVLEAFLGPRLGMYGDPGLGAQLSRAVKPLKAQNAVNLLRSLADGLEAAGRPDDGASVMAAYFGPNLECLTPAAGHPAIAIGNVLAIAQSWLRLQRRAPGWDCGATRVIDYLHTLFADAGLRGGNRREILRHTQDVRAELIEGALVDSGGAEPAFPSGTDRLVRAIVWDAELGEMGFGERLAQAAAEAGRGHVGHIDASLTTTNPFRPAAQPPYVREPVDTATPASPIPFGHDGAEPDLSTEPVYRLAPIQDVPAPPRVAPSDSADAPDLIAPIPTLRVLERALAQATGRDRVFLRLGLTADGHPVWYAYRAEGDSIRPVAPPRPRVGRRHAARTVVEAVARHDLLVDWTFLDALGTTIRNKEALLRQEVVGEINRSGQGLGKLQRIGTVLQECLGDPNTDRRVLHWLSKLDDVIWSVLRPTEGSKRDPDAALKWIGDLAATLVRYTASPPDNPMAWLSQQTDELARAVSSVFDLDRLRESAALDPAKTDLAIQVDGTLHGVPLSLLRVSGVPLWETVRSFRVTVAPTTEYRLAYERDVRPEPASPASLLFAGWAQPGDPVRRYAEALLSQHQGRHHPLYTAADEPLATPDYLRRMVSAGSPARVLTVVAHGSAGQSAVLLAPFDRGRGATAWDGKGIPLAGVEFLMLVSCAIGRLKGGGGRDVEGLIARLMESGATSVLAAKWAINAEEAVLVAGTVLDKYLHLRNSHSPTAALPLSTGWLRARALAEARRDLSNRAKAPGGLQNVLAAFELYGLG